MIFFPFFASVFALTLAFVVVSVFGRTALGRAVAKSDALVSMVELKSVEAVSHAREGR